MIVLYTTGCPRCLTLKQELEKANIEFTSFLDIEKMLLMGIDEVPVLLVDSTRMNFNQAIKWIKERGCSNE